MWSDIIVGLSVGLGLGFITVLLKKFWEIVILKRDMATFWKKYEHLEKMVERLDDRFDKLNTRVAIIESRDRK